MFGSGFEESTAVSSVPMVSRNTLVKNNGNGGGGQQDGEEVEGHGEEEEGESDTEDDWDEDDDSDLDVDSEEDGDEEIDEGTTFVERTTVSESRQGAGEGRSRTPEPLEASSSSHSDAAQSDNGEESEGGGPPPFFVDAPNSPSATPSRSHPAPPPLRSHRTTPRPRRASPADTRPRYHVAVTDSSYATYKAFLYYLYTDSITFAPLSSSYLVAKELAQGAGVKFPFSSRKEYLRSLCLGSGKEKDRGVGGRASAKAIYRLADKIGLVELRERAFEWIVKNLSVQNVSLSQGPVGGVEVEVEG